LRINFVKLFLAILAVGLTLAANVQGHDLLVPNLKLTPGRVARTDRERGGVTLKLEQKVFARYRLPWARRAEFKIDHLIPLELGGADTLDNLWPQSLRAKPYGADRKELLAEVLLQKVRTGRMTLAQTQEEIRKDWIDSFIDHVGMVYLKGGPNRD
jgi:hypothetical protein